MKIAALLMAAGLVLGACTPTTEGAPNDTASAAITACEKGGGKMQRVGRAQTLQCVIHYADAAKPCTDGAQCQGDCLADAEAAAAPVTGRCAATSNRFGCRTKIENGVAKATLCID